MKKYVDMLSGISLFRGAKSHEILPLLTVLAARDQSYDKGEILLRMGDRTTCFGIVLEGAVQIVKEDIGGNTVLLAQLESGALFAESFVCAGLPIAVTVQAVKNSVVLWVDYEKLRQPPAPYYAVCGRIAENLAEIFARKTIFLTGRIEHLSKRTLREKVLSYLSEQAVYAGSRRFAIPLNRQELADYLAVDRSALSAALGRLRDEGVIDFRKNQFTLL
jgi:CRP-like cAMP-binding protein